MKYPQCERLNQVRNQVAAILNFLDFIEEEGHDIDFGYIDRKDLVMNFFEIDAEELERERQHILENFE
jgi:hypothetical protein